MITRIQNNQLNSTKNDKMQRKNNAPAFGFKLKGNADKLWQEAKASGFLPEKQIQRFEAMLDDKATEHLTMDTITTAKNGNIDLVMTTSNNDAFRQSTVIHTAKPQPERFEYQTIRGFHNDIFNDLTISEYKTIPPKTPEEILKDQMSEIKNVLLGLTLKKVHSIDKKVLQDKESAQNWKKIEAAIKYAQEKTIDEKVLQDKESDQNLKKIETSIKSAQEKTPENQERQRLKIIGTDILEILKKSFQKTGVTQKDVKKMNNLVADTSLKDMTIWTAESKKPTEPSYSWIFSSKKQNYNDNNLLFTFDEKSPEKLTLGESIRSIFQPQKYFLADFLRNLTPKKLKAMEENPKYLTRDYGGSNRD